MSPLDGARALLAEAVGLPATAIADDASFEAVERWDSIAHLRLVLAIEQSIGRQVTPEETMALFSLSDIARFLAGATPPPAG
jgi:acyl carrier protein